MVIVFDSSGQGHDCAVLLDSGSEATFISESLVNKLRIKRSNARINVKGLGSSEAAVTRGSVSVNIAPIYGADKKCLLVDAFILNKLTSDLPSELVSVKDLSYLCSTNLADHNFSIPKKIDLISGADYFFYCLLPGQIVKSVTDPIA
ncbi:DUF1758 domain-containing protein [Nephila pilipes]|uniref:DUF1758 domain-containing protein n=1 Tax=Nephila pilipes TaxID=299642 RepID=A0A8X6MHF7_NEPPI|nr:DUF1758 domain-containing protein [Nephila pilipes]GFT60854.1 DUF1758 domain-containing protein [Nephila pilipes]